MFFGSSSERIKVILRGTRILPDNLFRDLLVNGIIAGIGGIIIFLPQIILLMFFMTLLEDTGYMTRVTFMMDRFMRKMGLHGKSVLPIMRSNQSGLIINITSIAGYHGLPFVGVYSASKASMEFLGESLNMELNKFGIRVVNIAPGDYKTEIINNRNDTKINQKYLYM